jgi:hypothetical protein
VNRIRVLALFSLRSKTKIVLLTTFIVAIVLGGVIFVESLNKTVSTASVHMPSTLEYTFKKVELNSSTVIPLFGREIFPEKVMIGIYVHKTEYNGEPEFLVGFYSDTDYLIVLTGKMELLINKVASNDTSVEYNIKLLLYNNTAMHFTSPEISSENSVLDNVLMTNPIVRKVSTDRGTVDVYITNKIVVETNVWVLKTTWEYTDGKMFYGIWPYSIPKKPMAILTPILYLSTEPGKQLGCIHFIETVSSRTAYPIQPSLIREHTEKLLKVMQESKQIQVTNNDKSISILYHGRQITPVSVMVPYKLVYNSDNILEKMTITQTIYDYSSSIALSKMFQEDESILLPPPLISKVGRAIYFMPYNDRSSMVELELVTSK